MSITQGDALPDITTTTTKKQELPDYYESFLKELATSGETALAKKASEGVAGYDVLQEQGYGALPAAATAYQPGLSAAEQTLGRAAQGVTGSRIQELMNPYTQNVVNEMARLSQQSLERSALPAIKSAFVGSGGIGSRGYGGALGQALAESQASLTGLQKKALQEGFSEAQRTALGELPYLVSAGQQQAQTAKMAQDLGLTGAGALTKAGAEKQAYEQSLLDYPLKTATQVSNLLRQYTMPVDTTETRVGPGQEGQYQKSDLDKVMGILSIIGATGGQGAAVTGGANRLIDYGKQFLKGLGIDLGSGVQEISNTAGPGETGYGWRYFDNGTAISPAGEYYFEGTKVWSPSSEEPPG